MSELSLDFTNLSGTEISANAGSRRDPNLLQCKPENGTNNQYELYMRFMIYPWDINKSMYSKNMVHIANPSVQKDGLTFDCPKSVGKQSFFYALDEVLRKRENAKIDEAITKEIRKYFKRWYQIHSLVYISTDAHHRENEGTCKIYTYGSKINKLITQEQQGTATKPKVNVFDFLTGKDFYYFATKQNQQFANYDQCKFVDKSSPFRFLKPDGSIHEVCAAELTDMAKGIQTPLSDFLQTKLPKMDEYFYKDPTSDQLSKSATLIRMILSRFPVIFNEALAASGDVEFNNMLLNGGSIPVAPQGNTQFGINPQFEQQQMQAPVSQVYNQAPQQQQVQNYNPVQQQIQPPVQTYNSAQQPQSPIYTQEQPQVQTYVPGQQSQISPSGYVPETQNPGNIENQPNVVLGNAGNDAFQNAMKNL